MFTQQVSVLSEEEGEFCLRNVWKGEEGENHPQILYTVLLPF